MLPQRKHRLLERRRATRQLDQILVSLSLFLFKSIILRRVSLFLSAPILIKFIMFLIYLFRSE